MQYGKKREYKTKGLEKNKSIKSVLNHGRHNYICRKSKSIYKLLELIYEFRKVSEHRVNINHQLYFLCQQQTENKSIHGPFTTAPKQIKYLGINLIKKM